MAVFCRFYSMTPGDYRALRVPEYLAFKRTMIDLLKAGASV